MHYFLTAGAAALLQEAIIAGLMLGDEYYKELQETYSRKRDFFLKGLDRIDLKHSIPQGPYFVMIDIQEFLDLPQFKGLSDLELLLCLERMTKICND